MHLVAVKHLPPPLVLFSVKAGAGLEGHLVVKGSNFGLVEVVVLAGQLSLPTIGCLAVAHQSKYYNTLHCHHPSKKSPFILKTTVMFLGQDLV